MSGWARKRFWSKVTVAAQADGFGVLLDGRPLRTPERRPLTVPTQALAGMIAAEWDAQQDTIRPDLMPATRSANVALDKLPATRAAVVDEIAGWGETDLLCYRATEPQALIARQAAAWDPLLDWAAARYGARLVVTAGVMPMPQPAEALAPLRAELERRDAFELCALHDLVALSGSLVIGLATAEGQSDPESLWRASRIDEDWQIECWGDDDEALSLSRARQTAFAQAARFFAACRRTGQ